MRSTLLFAVAILGAIVAMPANTLGIAKAQTVRFETSVGDFDMVLNPTNNPTLQPLVDNIIAYVGLGRYHYSAINRAVENNNDDPSDDFVLQMGGFLGFPRTPNLWPQLLSPVKSHGSVNVENFVQPGEVDGEFNVNIPGNTNTRGTVSLATQSGNPSSGSSSFFVNLGDNSDALDPMGFVTFAEIPDMTTVDRIMQLMQATLGSNAALLNVPLTDDGEIVIVERVSVVEADEDFSFVGPVAQAMRAIRDNQEFFNVTSSEAELVSSAFSASASSSGSGASASAGAAMATPEPHAALLLAAALPTLLTRRRK